ncbi:DNA polymerase Y family protein [Actinomadura rubrisoli]|uniref:DNA polymerase Y family protein n=1 Tax=Actinomadura rubrisoli TaxID=2530368 RepID=A0A4R5B6M6_9ACTN|nr:DNA polymerase Y family protein [Actinomadura rubrisoli]TDD80066.1 DNA polymerase Y family protein [Actinomadura rubrisoli]
MTRVLAVWCPDWPVTAVGVEAAVPGAVVVRGRVEACTAAARAEGVRRGQRIRDAQRRCPELVVRDRDRDAEGRLFEAVVTAVAEPAPRVEVVRPGLCAIPARGPARFYGGEEALRVLVQDAVVEAGYDCGSGIADGLFAAELAARAGQGGVVVPEGGTAGFLAPYPLSVLDRPDLADLLRRLGVKTLGAFAGLPSGHVAGRFGADGALAHRLARGEEPRPLAPVRASDDLSVRGDFDPPAAQAEQVVFAAKRLAGELHEGLAAGGLTCVRLEVAAGFADGHVLRRLWRHDGRLSALAVAERVRWQLSAWRSERPVPGTDPEGVETPVGDEAVWGGVAWLELVPDQLVPDEGRQEALWGRTAVTDRIARAADRIQALLGHRAITRPVLTGGRGPGEQVAKVPVGDLPPAGAGDGPWPGRVTAPAPAAVPPEAPPADVVDASGGPVVVSARCAVSAPPAALALGGGPAAAVTGWTGPWPADERWWDPARSRRRARFQVATDDGGAYLLAVEGGRWHMEASYD